MVCSWGILISRQGEKIGKVIALPKDLGGASLKGFFPKPCRGLFMIILLRLDVLMLKEDLIKGWYLLSRLKSLRFIAICEDETNENLHLIILDISNQLPEDTTLVGLALD